MVKNKKKKQIEQITPINDSDYEMSFSFGNNENPNGNDEGDGNQNPRTPVRNNRSYITVIILLAMLGLLIFFIVYFFVIRNQQSSSESYTSAAIVYNIDADHDGNYDVNSDGSNDYSKWTVRNNGSFTLQETANDGIVVNPGDLAKILIDTQSYSPEISVIVSYAHSDVYYLSGKYVVKTPNENGSITKTTHTFSATITKADREKYLDPIIENVKVLNDKNQYVSYYNSNKYSYTIQTQNNTSSWLVPLIFLILIGVIGYFFISRMLRQAGFGGSGNPMAGFVSNIGKRQNGSKVRFADVAGCDEVKAELVELVDYFHSTDRYTKLGAKLPHGVLLVGPPGTGKTLLAKAVAGEANVPFYSVSGSDFVEMYVGVGASRIRSLFKTAKANSPCLVFIDEIDAVGRQRGTGIGGGNDEREQTLNELLVEMDGFEDNSGVIVIAATNRSDVLDAALTRPGRFDRTVTVDLPDKKGRAAILKVHSRNKRVAEDVSYDAIAKRTVGFSGADLANIMNEAAILAVRANRNAITMNDIDEAIDRAYSGPAKKTHLEENEKKQVAYHESGHAVIGLFLPYSNVVQKISIIPRGMTGGHVLMTPENDQFILTKNQLLAEITGFLGGRTSEEIFFGDVSTGASSDIERATHIARTMVTQYGMSELGPIQYERPNGSVFLGRDYNSAAANYSTQIAFEIDKEVRKIIDECHKKAEEVLKEHKDDVELIAKTLIEHETITAEEISYLIKNRKLPEVDSHVITRNGNTPLNKQEIILYPGYEDFYIAIDRILVDNPSRIVITVACSKHPVSLPVFKQACVTNCTDPSRIGMIFIDSRQLEQVSLSIETFASHLEDYANVPVLLIKTDEESVQQLRNQYSKKPTPQVNEDDKKTDNSEEIKEDKVENTSQTETNEDKVDNDTQSEIKEDVKDDVSDKIEDKEVVDNKEDSTTDDLHDDADKSDNE